MVKLISSELPNDLGLIWLGALSFEDRCLGAIDLLPPEAVKHALIVEYSTKVQPLKRSQRARAQNKRLVIDRVAEKGASLGVRRVYPYRMSSMRKVLNEALELAISNSAALVVDTSCLTKIHCVGLAEWLFDNRHFHPDVQMYVQYCAPEQYSWQVSQAGPAAHFSELILAPLAGVGSVSPAEERKVDEDGQGDSPKDTALDAIAVLGHEGSRLRFSFSTFRVDRGLAVITGRVEEEDDLFMATLENWDFLSDAKAGRSGEWQIKTISQDDLNLWIGDINQFLSSRDGSRQVVILPLGPKPMILQTVLTCLSSPFADSWVSYPVPSNYRLNYSSGIGPVRTWQIDWTDTGVPAPTTA